MQIWVWSPSQKDPLEKEMATHSSILAWRIPQTKETGELATVHGIAKSQAWLEWLTQTKSIYLSNIAFHAKASLFTC